MLSLVLLASFGTLVSGGIMMDPMAPDALTTPSPPPFTESAAQVKINQFCLDECIQAPSCFLRDKEDCRYFIQCFAGKGSRLICGHGTFFDPVQDACVLINNVQSDCSRSLCLNKQEFYTFDHPDNNCRTYYECNATGIAIPKCCNLGYRYDVDSAMCVPIIDDECVSPCSVGGNTFTQCSAPGVYNEFSNDGNCRTYFECSNGETHAACCPPGERYDVVSSQCIPDPQGLCTKPCPKKSCDDPGVIGYADETYCGGYILCNGTNIKELRCCNEPLIYDEQLNDCAPASASDLLNCQSWCPTTQTHQYDCPLVGTEGGTGFYNIESPNNVFICAAGTLFDAATCGCSLTQTNPVDNSCPMEIDITMTRQGLLRNGTERLTAIEETGLKLLGQKFNADTETILFRNYNIKIPFLRSSFDQLFIYIVYFVDALPAPGTKMILISNCYQDRQLGATVEVSLESDGLITLRLVFSGASNLTNVDAVVLKLPYEVKKWTSFKAYYDGQVVKAVNDGGGDITSAAEASEAVPGLTITQASDGIEIGGCVKHGSNNVIVDNFVGSIATFKFTKCVQDEWKDSQMIKG